MATSGDFDLRDEDRLPWLETVDEDYAEGPGIIRTIFFVLLGLAAIAAIIYGVYWYQQTHGGQKGTGALIAAQEGDYKVKPDTPGGMKVEGEGDTAFATSEGQTGGNASIDLKAVPEAPVAGKTAPAPAPALTTKAVADVPPSAGKLTMPEPVKVPAKLPTVTAVKGAVVQLGSFPSEADANAAWAKSAKRFAYLAPLGKSVETATVNGRTVYRLRVNAGSAGAASDLCGKLKVAGEGCFIALN